MNKLYLTSNGVYLRKNNFGAIYAWIIPDGYKRPIWVGTSVPESELRILINQGELDLIANNYQEKPKCSQQDSHLLSCHASETTAKSSGLLSRICSLFSSNAKK